MSQIGDLSPSVESLVERIQDAVGLADTSSICHRVKDVLADEVVRTHIQVPAEYLQPVPNSYARRRLFKDPQSRFTIVVMVWGPGQATPLHDHAGHWCVECVYQGRIRVTSFDLVEDSSRGALRFSEQGSVISEVGGAGALIPPFEYHTISNPFEASAVTLHVYGGEITWCHCFEPLEESGWYRREKHELPYTV